MHFETVARHKPQQMDNRIRCHSDAFIPAVRTHKDCHPINTFPEVDLHLSGLLESS